MQYIKRIIPFILVNMNSKLTRPANCKINSKAKNCPKNEYLQEKGGFEGKLDGSEDNMKPTNCQQALPTFQILTVYKTRVIHETKKT